MPDTQEKIEALDAEIKALKDRGEKLEAKEKELAEKEKEVEREKENLITHRPVGHSSTSLESTAMAYFGCSNVKDLLAVNTGSPMFHGVPEETKAFVRQLKSDIDVNRWVAQMYIGGRLDSEDRPGDCRTVGETNYYKAVIAPKLKAFDTTTNTDWVAQLTASSYVEEFELVRALEGKVRSMQMPSKDWELPTNSGLTEARLQSENATMTDASFATSQILFQSQKLSEFMILPTELDQDSAPPIMAVMRQEIVNAQSRAVEHAMISGQKSGVIDTGDAPAGDSALNAWDGWRSLGISNSANGGTHDFAGPVDETALAAQRAKGGIFFTNPTNSLYICGPQVYNQLLNLTNVTTFEKFGPGATVRDGVLPRYSGTEVYVSGLFREDLNASGVHDNVTVDKGGLLLVNRERFYRGIRRPIQVRVVPDLPSNDRWLLYSNQRSDFKGVAQSASEIGVVYGINIQL